MGVGAGELDESNGDNGGDEDEHHGDVPAHQARHAHVEHVVPNLRAAEVLSHLVVIGDDGAIELVLKTGLNREVVEDLQELVPVHGELDSGIQRAVQGNEAQGRVEDVLSVLEHDVVGSLVRGQG